MKLKSNLTFLPVPLDRLHIGQFHHVRGGALGLGGLTEDDLLINGAGHQFHGSGISTDGAGEGSDVTADVLLGFRTETHLKLVQALAKDAKEIVSLPRNPILIKLFRFAKLGENAGYGIQRMKKWTALTGGNVDFKSEFTHTTVTYWRTKKSGFEHNSAQGSTQYSTQNSAQSHKEKVYDLIKANNTITAKKIAEKLGISHRTAQYDIEKFKKEKRIAREGGDFGGHYIILK